MNCWKVLARMRKVASKPSKQKERKYATWSDYMRYRFSRKCVYEGETLTYGALMMRFKRMGIEHYCSEATKYLEKSDED